MTSELFGETPLSFLLGTYFNQDWPEMYGTPEGAVQAFLVDNPDLATPLANEVEGQIALDPSEKELAKLVNSMYGNYLANKRGGTYRGWFSEIARQARAFAATQPQTDPGAGT